MVVPNFRVSVANDGVTSPGGESDASAPAETVSQPVDQLAVDVSVDGLSSHGDDDVVFAVVFERIVHDVELRNARHAVHLLRDQDRPPPRQEVEEVEVAPAGRPPELDLQVRTLHERDGDLQVVVRPRGVAL